jgi:hypothetical protein
VLLMNASPELVRCPRCHLSAYSSHLYMRAQKHVAPSILLHRMHHWKPPTTLHCLLLQACCWMPVHASRAAHSHWQTATGRHQSERDALIGAHKIVMDCLWTAVNHPHRVTCKHLEATQHLLEHIPRLARLQCPLFAHSRLYSLRQVTQKAREVVLQAEGRQVQAR